ncbi:siderophore biosynthesis protein SbnC, partial [Staphylococcus pseudintermedius]
DALMVTSMAALPAHESTLYARILETVHAPTEQINSLFEQVSYAFLKTTLAFLQYVVLPESLGQQGLVVFREGHAVVFVFRDHDTVRIFPGWLTRQVLKR